MLKLALVLLRDGSSFGVAGPMDQKEALQLKADGALDQYDYWKIIDFGAILHSTSKKYVIDDAFGLAELERKSKES